MRLLAMISWLLLVGWLVVYSRPAASQEIEQLPNDHAAFKQMICEMVVGNIAGHVQDERDLYLDLYIAPDADEPTGKSYGLLTGAYYGDRGVSGYGPTLDEPGSARFVSNGARFTNADAARLRSLTSEFRKDKCVAPT